MLLAVCLGLRMLSLVRPCLSDDEATYCVVAREMLHGRVLYRDIVDHKPPLIYLTYAATQSLGGPEHGMLLLHLLTIGFVWATALLLGRIAVQASRWAAFDDDVPFVAALLFIVFTTTLLDFDALAANCELYMLLPLTASVLLYLRGFARAADRRAPRRWRSGGRGRPLQVSGRGAAPSLPVSPGARASPSGGRPAPGLGGHRSRRCRAPRAGALGGQKGGGARRGAVLVLVQRGVHPAGVPALGVLGSRGRGSRTAFFQPSSSGSSAFGRWSSDGAAAARTLSVSSWSAGVR